MSLITALKDIVLGHAQTNKLVLCGGRVYCPWNGEDQDMERCLGCPSFVGLTDDGKAIECGYRKGTLPMEAEVSGHKMFH